MDKPKLTTVTYIEFNGEAFHEGDTVKFKKEAPFLRRRTSRAHYKS